MSEQAEIVAGEASEGTVEGPELESVMHLMWDRIEALERGRRAMQKAVAVGASVAVVALVVLSARSVGDRGDAGPIVLRDLAGRVRARLEVDPQGDQAMLRLFAADGSEQVALTSASAGPTLTLARGKDESRLRLGMDASAPLVEVVGRDGVTERQLLPASAPAAPSAPAVRQAHVRERESTPRGSMLWFPPGRKASRESCRPGTLGCERVSRISARSPEG